MSSPRSEELTQAAFWALIPLVIAWQTRHLVAYCFPDHTADSAKAIFAALYSEKDFASAPEVFYHALSIFTQANFALLSRAYLIVALGSFCLGFFVKYFGWVRTRIKKYPTFSKLLHQFALPRISEWHIALSTMLLVNPKQHSIEVDVMIGDGLLYRGSVQEKSIAADGSLQTLLLSSPERFLRPEFHRDRDAFDALPDKSLSKQPDTSTYWRKIPGELFLLVGKEIKSVNVRHVNTLASVKPNEDPELQHILREISEALAQRMNASKGPGPTPPQKP